MNNIHLTTFMCTPSHLKELAIGHLTARRLITSLEAVEMLGACDDMQKIYVRLAEALPETGLELGRIIPSGCGSGTRLEQDFIQHQKLTTDFQIEESVLTKAFSEMHQRAEAYHQTGGLHAAALLDANKLLAVQEDVGRHNAIDKIIGKAVLTGVDMKASALITTGRLSSDMVLKALGAGVPVLASRSIPTSLALEIAENAGITLVGRGHRNAPYFYCHVERVTGPKVQSLHTH